MKEFLARFFWGFVSNADSDVSTPGVLGSIFVVAWIVMYVWCQRNGQALKVTPLEATMVASALFVIPKVKS